MAQKLFGPSLRNTGAVLAGLFLVILLSTAADAFMHSKGVFPAPGQPMATQLWLIAILYRALFTFAAGWVTARLALEPRMRSVYILAGIGLAMGLLGVNLSLGHPEMGPLWYPVGVAVTGPLAAWLGGKFRVDSSPA